jgi:hypothetical protein
MISFCMSSSSRIVAGFAFGFAATSAMICKTVFCCAGACGWLTATAVPFFFGFAGGSGGGDAAAFFCSGFFAAAFSGSAFFFGVTSFMGSSSCCVCGVLIVLSGIRGLGANLLLFEPLALPLSAGSRELSEQFF